MRRQDGVYVNGVKLKEPYIGPLQTPEYDYGPERCSWLTHHLTNWMGDDGFMRSLKASIRRPNIFGDVSWCKGRVVDKRIEDGVALVELELSVDNQLGETTAKGSSVVALM